MEMWDLLANVVVLLAGALIAGGILAKFGQSPLVGYLLAGMLLGGPGSIGAVESEEEIAAVAELGVSLLLFSLGLEFSVARLRKLGRKPLLAGVLQVLVTLAVGAAAGVLAGLPPAEATAAGAMVALSSTAVVLRTLMERGELETPYGSNSLAVLLVQDMAVVPLAILMTMLAGGESPSDIATTAGRVFTVALLLIVGLYILLNQIAVRALRTLTLERNRELTIILSVGTGLGAAWAAHAGGISPALGAFVAGMFLGSSPFATQIRADVSPLRVVLLTLFFGSAGMIADPVWIFEHIVLVLMATAALLLVKLGVVWGIFRLLGQTHGIAATSAVCLCQIGEFAFVLGTMARENQVISEETEHLLVAATIVSLLVSPVLVTYAARIGTLLVSVIPRITSPPFRKSDDDLNAPEVVVVGFGPTGEMAAASAAAAGRRVLVIDLNHDGVVRATGAGYAGQLGDATQLEVLEHAHVPAAQLIAITIPHHGAALSIIRSVREMCPHVYVVARARYHRDKNDLQEAGAHAVFGDEEEIGGRIGRHVQETVSQAAGAAGDHHAADVGEGDAAAQTHGA